MSSARRSKLGKRVGGGALGLLLLACCGPKPAIVMVAPDGTVIKVGPVGAPPCGLSKNTNFAEDKAFLRRLKLFKYKGGAQADLLDAHCRTVWQEVVEARRCGNVAIPEFCKTCSTEGETSRCLEGNGRGLVMQRCREATLSEFTQNYPACKDFTLCASKLQVRTAECVAGRM